MSVQNIDICDYMSKQDIQLCKKFLSTASEREKKRFLSVVSSELFNLNDCPHEALDMRQSLFCNLYNTLREFFYLY